MTLVAAVVGLDLATVDFGISVRWINDDPVPDMLQEIQVNTTNLQLSVKSPSMDYFIRSLRISQMVSEAISSVKEKTAGVAKLIVGAEALPTRGAYNIGMLGELRGIVRRDLAVNLGVGLELVPLSSCRSTFLGKHGSRDIKKFTLATVRGICGWSTVGPDAADAFVVANHLCSLHGFPFLAGAGQGREGPRAHGGRKARSRKATPGVSGQPEGA